MALVTGLNVAISNTDKTFAAAGHTAANTTKIFRVNPLAVWNPNGISQITAYEPGQGYYYNMLAALNTGTDLIPPIPGGITPSVGSLTANFSGDAAPNLDNYTPDFGTIDNSTGISLLGDGTSNWASNSSIGKSYVYAATNVTFNIKFGAITPNISADPDFNATIVFYQAAGGNVSVALNLNADGTGSLAVAVAGTYSNPGVKQSLSLTGQNLSNLGILRFRVLNGNIYGSLNNINLPSVPVPSGFANEGQAFLVGNGSAIVDSVQITLP